jgi:hypothetical protein
VELLKVQPGGQMRRFNDGRWLHGRGRSFLHLFNGRFATGMEMPPDFVREVVIERTGVRFLVRNAQSRQVLYNHIAFHFQFTCQFVNPDLPHA